jgi:hypothetical protein
MNTDIFTIISNYSYLIAGLYLIYKKYYLYGIIGIIIWLISHMYHLDTNNCFWDYLDMIVAFCAFTYIIIKCFDKINCLKNYILLIALLIIFCNGFYCFYNHKYAYNIIHSIWHILSAFFIVYLVTS